MAPQEDRVPLAAVLQLPITASSTLHRYSVSKLIGEGGMGKVFLGYDHKLDREVAIKVLGQDEEASAEKTAAALRRFYREAKTLAALTHPNIIRLYDFSGPTVPIPFVVMELLQGRALDVLIGEQGLSEALVVAVMQGAAAALAEAHGKGLMHRDIKPENIMVEPNGRVVVLDFGLALGTLSSADIRSTFVASKTAVAGTASYASPEQLNNEPLTGASDIFSLAITSYFARSAVPPFVGKNVLEVVSAIKNDEPMALSLLAPVSRELEALLTGMLSKVPSARPSAQEVSDRCEGILRQLGMTGASVLSQVLLAKHLPPKPKPQPIVLGSDPEPVEQSVAASKPTARSKRPLAWMLLGLLAIVLPLVGVALWRVAPLLHKEAIVAEKTIIAQQAQDPAPVNVTLPAAPREAPKEVKVRLSVSPWGNVTIDGSYRGMTPSLRDVLLTIGEHEIIVNNPKFPQHKQRVDVRPDTTEIFVELD